MNNDYSIKDMADIHKAGAIIIQNRKLLVTCTKGKDIFICPGGKIEPGETIEQCLIRECKEELSIDLTLNDFEKFDTFFADRAEYDPSKKIRMDVFMIKSWQGTLQPSNEIGEVLWINSELNENRKIGSILHTRLFLNSKKLI